MDGTDADQFEFEATNHGDTLLAGLRHLRDKHQLFDVTLVVENLELPAHKVVLASCSDYFRAMFTDGLRECTQSRIVLNGVTARGMRNLLDFAYTSKSNIDSDNVFDVLGASTHVQILPVIDACEDFLRTHLSLDNCVDIASVADLYSLRPLSEYVQHFICKHWTTFTLGSDFLRMEHQPLVNVLESGFPVDCSESDVLSAILSWVKYSEDREQFLEDVLKHVQFDNISEEDYKGILAIHDWKSLAEKVPCLKERFGKWIGDEIFVEVRDDVGQRTVEGVANMRGLRETVLVAGGFSGESGMTNNIWYYDDSSSVLKILTKIPHVEQCNFGMTVLDNKLYVIGGCFNDHFEEVIHPFGFCYDSVKDEWKSIAPMVHERCRFYLGQCEGRLYAIGGDPLASDITLEGAPCECYDPGSNSWEELEPMPGNRTQHAGVVVGHCLFISGGQQETDGEILSDFLRYDTRNASWEMCASLLSPRVDHSMFYHNGRVYVIGGWRYDLTNHQREMLSTIDCYDIEQDSWETVATLNHSRLYATYTLFDGVIFVIGGWKQGDYRQKSDSVDCLDLDNLQWKDSKHQEMLVWEHNSCTLYLPKFIKS